MTAMIDKATRIFQCLFICLVLALASVTIRGYPGSWLAYATFTVAFHVLLFLGFNKKRIFFDTFIGLFFWLGFWLKFSIRMVFSHGRFLEPLGSFDSTSTAYDHALWVASFGAAAFIAATLLRRLFFSYDRISESLTVNDFQGILGF